MPISVNTNTNALLAQQSLIKNQAGLAQAMQRLSSGLRINDAADDPAGLAIATTMGNTSAALTQAARNANDGISLLQTAEGAISDINTLISQMSTLAVQASSGTYASAQLSDLNTEFVALLAEVNRVANVTSFNGVSLLNNTNTVTIQIGSGDTTNDRLKLTLSNLTTGTSGLNISGLAITSNSTAQAALSTLNAITSVSTALASFGASEVNLTAVYNVDTSTANSLTTAEARIQDADFAAESTNLARFNILNQSNIAMLAQANSTPQQVLQLLRG